MKIIVFLILIISSLFGISLPEYINLALVNSNDARLLIENNMNTKLDYNLAKNDYNSNYSPISSFKADSDSNSFRLGLEGNKKNIYGGKIYGSFNNTFEDRDERLYTSGATVGYKQSLFQKFGEAYNTISLYSAKEKIKLIEIQNRDQKATIILTAIANYYDTVLNSAKIKIQEKSLKRVKSNYDAAKAKQKSGIVSKIDVYRAKIAFLNQNKNLNDSIKRYKDSLENLYYYLNQDVADNISIDETLSTKQIENDIVLKEDIDILMVNLDWNDMILTEKILKKQLYNANKDFLPDVELDVNYRKFSFNNGLSRTLDMNEDSWSVGINSNYGFNTTDQDINRQKLVIQKSRLSRDKHFLRRFIFKELHGLKNDYVTIIENLEIYKLKKQESQDS